MEELNYKLGLLFSIPDVRDYIAHSNKPDEEIPKEFTLDSLPSVKNQGAVGSCVAHAIALVAEYYARKETGKKTKMSTGYIYGNRLFTTHKGSGMYLRDALKTMTKFGDVPYEYFPDNVEVPYAIELFEQKVEEIEPLGYNFKFKAYYKLTTEKDIKTHLLSGNPVIMAMPWYDDIKIVNGVMSTRCVKTAKTGGHCMVIYGWNDIGWKVQNSWGSYWGDKGHVVIPYEVPFNEVWGIKDAASTSSLVVKKPFSTEFGAKIAKFLNRIVLFVYNIFLVIQFYHTSS